MNHKIVKNYIFTLMYQLLVLLVPLITAPYLARTLGPEGTGAYGYVYSMTSIINTLVLLGVYNYGNRQIAYVRDDCKKMSEVFWQIMSIRLMLAIFGTIIYFGVVFFVKKYVVLFVLYYTFLLANFIDPTWLYVGVEDMKWEVIKNAITKVLAVLGIFIFVKNTDDLPAYVFIQGFSVLLSNILSYSQLKRYISRFKLDFSRIKEDLVGSVMLFLPSIAATIYTQCDKVMIELITGNSSQVAFYDYSEKIVTIPLTFITALSTVMMPRIANEFKKGNNAKIQNLLISAARFSMFIAIPMTVGLMSVASKLVPWYLGESFAPTISAIVLISPIVISNTLTGISGGQYFTATNQMKVLILSQFFAAVANVLINAILIPVYGFYGAAVATLITSFSCAIIQYVYLFRQVRLPGVLRSALKYAVFSLIMYIAIYLVTHQMNASPKTNILQIIIGAVVYLLLCVLSKDSEMWLLINKFKMLIKKAKTHNKN